MSARTTPVLDADLTAGLRRLKLAAMRQLAPELLATAKTQRWAPEEVLRALVAGRDRRPGRLQPAGTAQGRGLPLLKNIEEFDLTASSISAPTWAYLTCLE